MPQCDMELTVLLKDERLEQVESMQTRLRRMSCRVLQVCFPGSENSN